MRSKTASGVYQEFWGFLLAHHAVRSIMHEAALRSEIDPDRLSYSHAVRVIRRKLPLFTITPPREWPKRYEALLEEVAQVRVPVRKPRDNPRAVKRKMSNFPLRKHNALGSKPNTERRIMLVNLK